MRYKKTLDWLKKSVVTDIDLAKAEFAYWELNLIANFDKKKLVKEQPDLIEYFKEVL